MDRDEHPHQLTEGQILFSKHTRLGRNSLNRQDPPRVGNIPIKPISLCYVDIQTNIQHLKKCALKAKLANTNTHLAQPPSHSCILLTMDRLHPQDRLI